MLTIQQCKRMILQSALQAGISPRLISERLLSDEDKQDMLNEEISQDCLNLHVEIWMRLKMPDYRNGSMKPYNQFYEATSYKGIT